jgi:PST family polysaccharide transporter/lipopolysaccharide exporter
MAIGLALLAQPIVVIAFSAKWIDVVPVVPPICLYALFVSISFNIGDLYKALGRPDILTQLGVARLALAVPALWAGAALVGTPAAVGWAQAGIAFAMMGVELVVARSVFRVPIGAVARRRRARARPPAARWRSRCAERARCSRTPTGSS